MVVNWKEKKVFNDEKMTIMWLCEYRLYVEWLSLSHQLESNKRQKPKLGYCVSNLVLHSVHQPACTYKPNNSVDTLIIPQQIQDTISVQSW